MTNIELIQAIKAEIERRMKELDEQIVDIYDSKAVLRKDELQKHLSFLSTLESEKPNQEELEEEINKAAKSDIRPEEISDYDFCYIARYFAQWGAEHLADERKMIELEKKEGRTDCSPQGEVPNDSLATQSYEKIPNDLEEAAKVYFENPKNSWQVKDVFISGAKWGAEHLKK